MIRPSYLAAQPNFSFCFPDSLLTGEREVLQGHGLLVDEKGCIRAILPASDCPVAVVVHKFPGECWVAAPVLAHAHLESLTAPSTEWPRSPFSSWVKALIEWRSSATESSAECHTAIPQRLLDSGCARVASHLSWPSPSSPSWPWERWKDWLILPECFAPCNSAGETRHSVSEILQNADIAAVAGAAGFALHAPYSVSLRTGQALSSFCEQRGLLLSVHLGEHPEELACLNGQPNSLSKFFQSRGLQPCMGSNSTPVDWLEEVGALRKGVLAVHTAELTTEQLSRLDHAGVSRVWCPGAHEYFQRETPRHFLSAGLPLPALGCDSMASNIALDPLHEVRTARRLLPEPGPEAWWDALTVGGAAALGRGDKWGKLLPGYQAEVLRISQPIGQTSAEICDALTSHDDISATFGKMSAHGFLS